MKQRSDTTFLLVAMLLGCSVLWRYGLAGAAIFALAWLMGACFEAAAIRWIRAQEK